MTLECVIVDGSSDGLGKYGRIFISGLAVSCMLLRADWHLKNHWSWDLDSWVHCCDVLCQVIAVVARCVRVAFCQPGMFFSCLGSVGTTRGILKSACN